MSPGNGPEIPWKCVRLAAELSKFLCLRIFWVPRIGSIHSETLADGYGLVDFKRHGFGGLGPELLGEPGHVIGKDPGLMAGTGDSDVAEAGTEQIGMDARVGVDQHALGGESLGTVAGDRVAVVKVAVLYSIEFELPIVEKCDDVAVRLNGLDHGEIPVGDAKLFVRRSELDAVAGGEVVYHLSIDADAGQAARIISDAFA